jgi:endonuclease/exonuclease/phosphatase (EEP) superfamily protein YafD
VNVRSSFAGAFATLSAFATGLGLFAWGTPTDQVFGPLARLLDAFAPALIAVGLLCALVAVGFGTRRFGVVLALLALCGGGVMFKSFRDLSAPVGIGRTADLSILFFNAQAENTGAADAIVQAVLREAPDIVVLAEAEAVLSARARLEAFYSFVSPCTEEVCELLVATNLQPRRFWQLQLNPAWPARYAVLEIEQANGQGMFLAASHLAKPWMSGISESEIARLIAQYNWLTDPVVAVGDFNMAPWSQPMRDVLNQTGLRAVRGQPASWPAAAGRLGLPIDQVLVRGGPIVTGLRSFGEELNSNHLGFIADVAVDPRAQ